MALISAGVLCRQDHFVTVTATSHPIAEPLLRVTVVIHAGCVDEVAALLVEVVQPYKSVLPCEYTPDLLVFPCQAILCYGNVFHGGHTGDVAVRPLKSQR